MAILWQQKKSNWGYLTNHSEMQRQQLLNTRILRRFIFKLLEHNCNQN